MLDTILLLTGATEQPVLSARLVACNGALTVLPIASREALVAVPEDVLARARLIGFATPVVVPAPVLEALGYGAYNFHPGPPEFPGLCPAQYAIYTGARRFGVTAHRMVARVDAGPIVGVTTFDVTPPVAVRDLEIMSYRALARVFWELAPALALFPEPLDELPLQWGTNKSSRRSAEALCEIAPDVAKDELDRIVAAFGEAPFGIAPTLTLHGHRFRLVRDAEPEAAPEPEQKPLAS